MWFNYKALDFFVVWLYESLNIKFKKLHSFSGLQKISLIIWISFRFCLPTSANVFTDWVKSYECLSWNKISVNEISEEENIVRRSLIPYESFYSSEPFPFRPLNCNRFKVGLSLTFDFVEFSRSLLPFYALKTTTNPFKQFSISLYIIQIRYILLLQY